MDIDVEIAKPKQKLEKPPLYKVILYNDNFTTMEFVILVLKKFFQKGSAEAESIMLKIHEQGRGICGVYPFDIAETKVFLVNKFAREHEYPLLCGLEVE